MPARRPSGRLTPKAPPDAFLGFSRASREPVQPRRCGYPMTALDDRPRCDYPGIRCREHRLRLRAAPGDDGMIQTVLPPDRTAKDRWQPVVQPYRFRASTRSAGWSPYPGKCSCRAWGRLRMTADPRRLTRANWLFAGTWLVVFSRRARTAAGRSSTRMAIARGTRNRGL